MVLGMNREDRFRLLAAMALADGELHEQEKERLLSLGRLIGIRPFKAEILLREVAGTSLKRLKIPKRRVERYGLFQDLVLIAAQDGEIDASERKLLGKLAPHFGIGPEELGRLLESSLSALRSDTAGAPLFESDKAEGLSELLRAALAAREGEDRLSLVAALARAEGWEGDAEDPCWVRCAERLRVSPARAREILAAADPARAPDALPPKEYRDGLRTFGHLVGLNRLRDLVEGEEDFLQRVSARFGVGEVLLRRKLYLYVPQAKRPPSED